MSVIERGLPIFIVLPLCNSAGGENSSDCLEINRQGNHH